MHFLESRIIKTAAVEWRRLKWFHTNLKTISRMSIEKLKNSLKTNNFIQPFNVWDTSGTIYILDGQYRQRAMLELERDGYSIPDMLPANFICCSDRTEATKITLLYSSVYASIDTAGLESFLCDNGLDIASLTNEIELAAFDMSTITGGSAEPQGTNNSDVDDIPAPPANPMTNPGDLYELGPHRLLCGNATRLDHALRIIGDRRASMVFTDPPYGVSYKSQSGKFDMIKNDDKTEDDLVNSLLLPAFKVAAAISDPDAAFYIWHASGTRDDFSYAMKSAGLIEIQYLIWAKPGFVIGHSDYQPAHEPCFYAVKQGNKPIFYGDRSQPTVWRFALHTFNNISTVIDSGITLIDGHGGRIFVAPKAPKGKKIRTFRISPGKEMLLTTDNKANDLWFVSRDGMADHPTQKPVELAIRAIENSSLPGDIVWDGFLGSGTTLIGAEATGRICCGTELDPRYCDVIVNRYVKYTGNKIIIRNNEKIEWV